MAIKSSARVQFHSFKYVNLIIWKEKYIFMENWLIFLGIWGDTKLILRILGAKEAYFQGAGEFSFMNLGRSMHYFQGSREHRSPWGLHSSWINNLYFIFWFEYSSAFIFV